MPANGPSPGCKRRRAFLSGAVVLALLLPATALGGLDVPRLQGRVNDHAGMLSPSATRRLEALLADLERREGTQIVVLTIPSLAGDSLEAFSLRTAEAWGIGQKENDNGALLLIAQKERKIRIEVGYGLEGRLTDLMAGRIIRNTMLPQFKMGRIDQGVIEGVAAMIDTVRGEYTVAESPPRPRAERRASPVLIGLIALLLLIRVVGRVNPAMGAAAGGVLAPIAGLLFFHLGIMLLLALIPLGAVGGFLLGLPGQRLSNSHITTRTRRGSYWGGGFGVGGGGFSSGGGFGGFSGGGGGFGGGGASGGW